MDMLFGTFASKSLFIVRVVLGVISSAGARKCSLLRWTGLRGVIATSSNRSVRNADVLAALSRLGGVA